MNNKPKCTLRDAWMSLNSRRNLPNLTDYERRSLSLLLDTAAALVNYYDEAELAASTSTTSGADDAAALYNILNDAGLPVA